MWTLGRLRRGVVPGLVLFALLAPVSAVAAVSGSDLTGPDRYHPGGTNDFVFLCSARTSGQEWLSHISVHYPPQFQPVKSFDAQGDQAGLLTVFTGGYHTVEWVSDHVQGYGAVSDGHSVLLTNRVAVSGSATGSLEIVYVIEGDGYGELPHSVTGKLTLVEAATPIHYVDLGGGNVFPFTNATDAAHTIQAAVDAAAAGDSVVVADGIYDQGGAYGVVNTWGMSNRVLVTKPIHIRSVNGPDATTIVGAGPIGGTAMRGVCIATNATLSGFTITSGHTGDGPHSGGGAWCAPDAVISNCTLVYNQSGSAGGGVHQGMLYGCRIESNHAVGSGGGAYNSVLMNCRVLDNSSDHHGGGLYVGSAVNCFISGNRAYHGGGSAGTALRSCTISYNEAESNGGGVWDGVVSNSIIYYNTALHGANWDSATLTYTCTAPISGGEGNVSDAPGLLGPRDPHIIAASPCIDAGTNDVALAGALDIDGESRIFGKGMDIGCDEFVPGTQTGALWVVVSPPPTVVVGYPVPFEAVIQGRALGYAWMWDDGGSLAGVLEPAHAYSNAGTYAVTLTASNITDLATYTVSVEVVIGYTNYVSQGSPNPETPYTSWQTAAHEIQQAVDANGVHGGTVLVSNGVYETGERVVQGESMNRVAIWQPLILKSRSGWYATTIRGAGPTGTCVRCVHLGKQAELIGFRLQNGHARGGSDINRDQSGGGVWCDSGSKVSSCYIEACSAEYAGGAAYGGTLMDCEIYNNSADVGGGTMGAIVLDSHYNANTAESYGGAAVGGRIERSSIADNGASRGGATANTRLLACTVLRNTATHYGGGLYQGSAQDCLIAENESGNRGGGACWSTLEGCTIVTNMAATSGGGVYDCEGRNTIIYMNYAPAATNWDLGEWSYSCSVPMLPGTNNLAADPVFLEPNAGIYRLRGGSPCVDAGVLDERMETAFDVAGNPRLFNGSVDMGAYEFTVTTYASLYLAGPYIEVRRLMTTSLVTSNLMPQTSPYKADVATATALLPTTTDWVLLALVETNNLTTVAARSGLLDSTGAVFGPQGQGGVRLEAPPGHYYLVAKHRNHCTAMSGQPVAFTNESVSYAFADGRQQYSDTNGCVELESGVWGLLPGDADGDGRITWVDRAVVSNSLGKTGYVQADVNLDGIVTVEDLP